MAPSPRKTAPSTFTQTWDETDASFLDPTSLPLSKVPRGWERKTQVTISRDGKQRKVFRRYALRSGAANTPDVEEDDEEEHDSRSRAIKRLQRMSPDAMEKNAAMTKGKRRAFKATRWDRRKSVLPRKKASPIDAPLGDMDEPVDVDGNTLESIQAGNDSASEWDMMVEEEAAPALTSLVDDDKKRSTISFTFDGQHDDPTGEEPSNLPEPVESSMPTSSESELEDNTLQFTFRSPSKAASSLKRTQFMENVNPSPRMDQDSTMQFLFRSPSKRTSPVKRLQFSNETRPSPRNKEVGTHGLLFRSSSKITSPTKVVKLARKMSSSPGVENVQLPSRSPRNSVSPTKSTHIAEEVAPSPDAEQDGTIQLLFQSPSRDSAPVDQNHIAEEADCVATPYAEEEDVMDSDMSEMLEEERATTFGEVSEVLAPSSVTVADEAHENSFFQEDEARLKELSVLDESSVSILALTHVPHTSHAQEPSLVVSDTPVQADEDEDLEMTEITFSLGDVVSPQNPNITSEVEATAVTALPEQENTMAEASLQLDLQRDVEMTLEEERIEDQVLEEQGIASVESNISDEEDNVVADVDASPDPDMETAERQTESDLPEGNILNDIAEGLTLDLSIPGSAAPTPRRLRSLSPPPQDETGLDDVTTTIAIDDDTAILKDFLTRAAANKANKVTTIARRSSLINRRDSGAVRHALASPRKILEDKDTNSPSKYDNDVTVDLTQTITLNTGLPLSPTTEQADVEDAEESKASRSSRRSTRARKSRLPAPSSAPQPPQGPTSISVRRADGTEPIVLKRTEAQEMGLLTRANTRKNKQGAFSVSVKLFSLNNEVAKNSIEAAKDDTKTSATDAMSGKKNVRWDETLEYFQEGTDTQANMKADAESLATPDELSLPLSSSSKSKIKVPKDKASTSTPKIRRVRGLGAANGTPGKGLLCPSSMLPEDVLDEKEKDAPGPSLQHLPKPKTSRVKKMAVAPSLADKVPSSITSSIPAPHSHEILPTTTEPAKEAPKISQERKSRLATPKRVRLPQPVSAARVPVEGKENQQTRGIAAATPKKGIPMPVPQVIAPPAVETGLPRRRARKL